MANEKWLIDAYKLEDLVRSNSARYHHADDVIAAIARQPIVDAVEVVRCKECDWYREDGGICVNPKCTKSWYGCPVPPNHYCGYGEKREGKKNGHDE